MADNVEEMATFCGLILSDKRCNKKKGRWIKKLRQRKLGLMFAELFCFLMLTVVMLCLDCIMFCCFI